MEAVRGIYPSPRKERNRMKNIIESTKSRNADVPETSALIFGPLYAAYRRYYSLFWSVFGPAAQYCFSYPKVAYAASMMRY
jgi:hypothetical protein